MHDTYILHSAPDGRWQRRATWLTAQGLKQLERH